MRIKCTLWGGYADEVSSNMRDLKPGPIVMDILIAKMKIYVGMLSEKIKNIIIKYI